MKIVSQVTCLGCILSTREKEDEMFVYLSTREKEDEMFAILTEDECLSSLNSDPS